jgi:hypothetical protein
MHANQQDFQVFVVLGVLFVFSLAPIWFAARIFKRKGYSILWTWFAVVSIVGLLVLGFVPLVAIVDLLVLGVAFLFPDKSEAAESTSVPELLPTSAAYLQYTKGMKNLGIGLISLGLLHAFLAAISLALRIPQGRAISIVVGVIGALNILLGILARRLHGWVNYAVAVAAFVLIVANLNSLGTTKDSTKTPPGSAIGACLGVIVAAAFLYFSVKNIQKMGQVRRASPSIVPAHQPLAVGKARIEPGWLVPLAFTLAGFFATLVRLPPSHSGSNGTAYNIGYASFPAVLAGLLGLVINMLRDERPTFHRLVLIPIGFILVTTLLVSCTVQPGR